MSDYYVGLVARESGWLAVAYTNDGFDHADVFDGIGPLWTRYEEAAELIAVDVPIGLESTSSPRPNEQFARRLLNDGATPVVSAPVRDAVRKHRYRTAARVHERKAGTDLSRLAFQRAPFMSAVDEFLAAIEDARSIFVEAHPGLCYLAFDGDPMTEPDDAAAGYAERMRTLAEFDRDAPPTVQAVAAETTGRRMPIPAVLDAVALGLTVRPGPGSVRTLPSNPPRDERGLSMQYVYRSETSLGNK